MASMPRGLRSLAVLAVTVVAGGNATAAAFYAGGGKDAAKGNDCLIGYGNIDAHEVASVRKKATVTCTDCDPACDADGLPAADGSCTFAVEPCLAQPGIAGCTPPSSLDQAKATAKVHGRHAPMTIDVGSTLEGAVCGPPTDVVVPIGANRKNGKATVKLVARAAHRKDKDRLAYLCRPRPAGEPCPTASTTTSTSSTTSTTAYAVLRFVTGAPVGECGRIAADASDGTPLETLGCGGLNVGGGTSTVAEGPTPAKASTLLTATCAGETCAVNERTAAQTGSNLDCSDAGCQFGPFLPIANAGTSTCVRNTFLAPASGILHRVTGAFDGSFPLSSVVTLTANATEPCPLCLVAGVPGEGEGVCSASAANAGGSCTGINAAGNTYDCLPAGFEFTAFAVDLTPITTACASKSAADGLFCPSQTDPGAFGNPEARYIEECGSPAGPITPLVPSDVTLASVFCIPATGNFVVDAAANLPGPGATSLPGTFELRPPPEGEGT